MSSTLTRTFIPLPVGPFGYGYGPAHNFFEWRQNSPPPPSPPPPPQPTLSNPGNNSASPLENAFSEQMLASAGEFSPPLSGISEHFENPNISYNPAWGNIGLTVAGLLGGPLASTLAGAGMGANMAQAINEEFSSRGFAPPAGVPESTLSGALAGAARGALGMLGGILGLTPEWDAMTQAYSAMPSVQAANDFWGATQAIAQNPGVFSGYTVAGLAPEDLGAMGNYGGNVTGGDNGAADNSFADSGGFQDAGMWGGIDTSGWGDSWGYRAGGLVELFGGGKVAVGPGGGLDDLIPTTIDGRRAARLSDGEFVIPADVVSMLGDGSSREGSRRLYNLVREVRRAKTGTSRQAGQLPFDRIIRNTLQ